MKLHPLRAGVAGARGAVPTGGGVETPILGPTGEARLGVLAGHFGASISYRLIWNFLSSNPDIHVLGVNGEIRF